MHSHWTQREYSRHKWEYLRECCFHTGNELFGLLVYHNTLLCLHIGFDINGHLQLLNVNRRNNHGSELGINIVVIITTPKKGEKTEFTFLPIKT